MVEHFFFANRKPKEKIKVKEIAKIDNHMIINRYHHQEKKGLTA